MKIPISPGVKFGFDSVPGLACVEAARASGIDKMLEKCAALNSMDFGKTTASKMFQFKVTELGVDFSNVVGVQGMSAIVTESAATLIADSHTGPWAADVLGDFTATAPGCHALQAWAVNNGVGLGASDAWKDLTATTVGPQAWVGSDPFAAAKEALRPFAEQMGNRSEIGWRLSAMVGTEAGRTATDGLGMKVVQAAREAGLLEFAESAASRLFSGGGHQAPWAAMWEQLSVSDWEAAVEQSVGLDLGGEIWLRAMGVARQCGDLTAPQKLTVLSLGLAALAFVVGPLGEPRLAQVLGVASFIAGAMALVADLDDSAHRRD